jgi:hypothetical protein
MQAQCPVLTESGDEREGLGFCVWDELIRAKYDGEAEKSGPAATEWGQRSRRGVTGTWGRGRNGPVQRTIYHLRAAARPTCLTICAALRAAAWPAYKCHAAAPRSRTDTATAQIHPTRATLRGQRADHERDVLPRAGISHRQGKRMVGRWAHLSLAPQSFSSRSAVAVRGQGSRGRTSRRSCWGCRSGSRGHSSKRKTASWT